MECIVDDDVNNGGSEATYNPIMQSPREIWGELGLMIPVLDMLNHDIESQSVKWESPNMQSNVIDNETSNKEEGKENDVVMMNHPRAVMEKEVQKGQQIYTCYGNELSNRLLMLQYGFAQVDNDSDELPLGWGLMDCVGN